MAIREFVNELSLLESKIKSLRIILNLPLTQNRNLSASEKEKVLKELEEMILILNKHKEGL